jgi:sugar phosphate isomerase/epimerase
MRPDQIALQLYTVRRLLADDVPGTLRAVAAAGYRNVEVAGVPDSAQDSLAGALADAGLSSVAVHVGIDQLRTGVRPVADWLEALRCPRAIVPWLPEEQRQSTGAVRTFAAELNGVARQLADRGIRLGYHNHAFEFAPLDGTTVWDVLLAELVPGIEVELDVYWASIGGRDPVEEIQRAGTRVRLLHMKDRAAGPQPHDAPAGQGTLDFPTIVRAGRDAGVEWYIAEQDNPRDELTDIASAFRYLESQAGVGG